MDNKVRNDKLVFVKETIGGHPVRNLKYSGDKIIGEVRGKYNTEGEFEETFWMKTNVEDYYESSMGSEWFDLDLNK